MSNEPVSSADGESRITESLKVLLVADELFRGSDFMTELRRHIKGKSAEVQLFVTAPALAGSAFAHLAADFDEPIKEANDRLETVLAELKEAGLEAVGQVGDGDPVLAIGDGLRQFDADEIIVVAHEKDERAYAEKDLWKRIEDEFDQPVVALFVGKPEADGTAPAVTEVKRDENE